MTVRLPVLQDAMTVNEITQTEAHDCALENCANEVNEAVISVLLTLDECDFE